MDNNKTLSNPETASNKAPSKLTFIYYDEDEFAAFLDSLPLTVASKVIARIREVSTIGIAEAMTLQLVKKVDRKKDIFELRINTEGIFARSLFFRLEKANEEENNVASPTYIITNSFKKKTNNTPSKELKKAIKRKSNYRNKR